MPAYFFDICTDAVKADERGAELADDAAAWAYARDLAAWELAKNIASDAIANPETDQRVDIWNENNDLLGSVSFDQLMVGRGAP